MRRVWAGGFAIAMMLVLAGCPTPPPAGYRPPTIDSVQVTPQPVQPGDTVTMVLDVRDDYGLTTAFGRDLTTPSGSQLPDTGRCSTELTPQEGMTHVLVTVSCVVPEYASNGTWRLEVRLLDSTPPVLYPGTTRVIPFEVTGGTEDRRGPELVSHSVEPAVVDQETTFVLTARLRDEALPVRIGSGDGTINFAKLFAQNSMFTCRNAAFAPVSATEVDLTISCTPSNFYNPGRAEPGLHLGRVVMRDALGQESFDDIVIDVQPGPAV